MDAMADFDDLFPVDEQILTNNRKWKADSSYVKGRFTDDEMKLIQESMIQYGVEHNLSSEDFSKLVTESCKKEMPRAWLEIAKVLPHRSVLSVYNQVKQKLNPDNYQGRWSKEEEEQLIALVKEHGRKFKEISKIMKRTPLNIKDKLRTMGDHNYEYRDTLKWTVGELVQFFRWLNQYQGHKFIKKNWEEYLVERFGEEWEDIPIKTSCSTRKQKKTMNLAVLQDETQIQSIFNIIDVEEFKKIRVIPWTKIATKVKSKSVDDLRNLWNTQLNSWLMMTKQEVDEKQFILDIKAQDPSDEEDINYDFVLPGSTISQVEKHKQWNDLKKRIQLRDKISLRELLGRMERQFLSKKEQKEQKALQTQFDVLMEQYNSQFIKK